MSQGGAPGLGVLSPLYGLGGDGFSCSAGGIECRGSANTSERAVGVAPSRALFWCGASLFPNPCPKSTGHAHTHGCAFRQALCGRSSGGLRTSAGALGEQRASSPRAPRLRVARSRLARTGHSFVGSSAGVACRQRGSARVGSFRSPLISPQTKLLLKAAARPGREGFDLWASRHSFQVRPSDPNPTSLGAGGQRLQGTQDIPSGSCFQNRRLKRSRPPRCAYSEVRFFIPPRPPNSLPNTTHFRARCAQREIGEALS